MDNAVAASTRTAPTAPETETPASSVVDRRDAVPQEGDAPVVPTESEAALDVSKEDKEKTELQKGVQRRIDKITKARYEAEARAKMLEERIAQLEQRQQPSVQPVQRPVDGAPTIDQFNNFDEYVTAKAEFIAKQHIEQALTERERRQMTERQTASQAKLDAEWNKRVEKATAEMPDFEDVITASEAPMTEPMKQAIKESDLGPKLAYYLAGHPDEAATIADMTPLRAIAALGRLEERLSKPAEKKVTSAPAPITPVGGSSKVSKDPADMSQTEFERWRRSVIKAR